MNKVLLWKSTDLTKWLRLIHAARDLAADPSRPTGDLAKRLDEANKAVIPTHDGVGRAECFTFFRFARTFTALAEAGRAENAEALRAHADKAHGWIVPKARDERPASAARPFRADTDG